MCLRNYCTKKKQPEDNTKPVKEKIRNSSFNLKNYWKKNHFISIKTICFDLKKTIFKGKCILTKKITKEDENGIAFLTNICMRVLFQYLRQYQTIILN